MFSWFMPQGEPMPGQAVEADQAAIADAPPVDDYLVGLDLGQSLDFSAMIALRRRVGFGPRGERLPPTYTVRGAKRWPLKTLYTTIAEDVVRIVSAPPLRGCVLGIDRTGCGQPVVDLIVKHGPEAKVKPVLITGGAEYQQDGPGWHVAKVLLVATVQTVLQTRRLEIPAEIRERKILEKELLAFRAKVTAKGSEIFEADWRSRQHDDYVLALAIATWLGERGLRRFTMFY